MLYSSIYVVKRNVVVPYSTRSEKKTLRLGSVMKGSTILERSNIILHYANETVDKSHEEFVVNVADLKQVPPELCYALLSVASPFDRINIAMDSLLCSELAKIKVDDKVLYFDDSKNMWVKCIVKTIGLIPEYGEGHYYGLQLLEKSFKTSGSPITHASVEKLRPFFEKEYNVEYSGAVKYSEVFCNVNKSVGKVEEYENSLTPKHLNPCNISEVNLKREEKECRQNFPFEQPHSEYNKRDLVSRNNCEKALNVIKDSKIHFVKQYQKNNEVRQGKCKTSLNIVLSNDFAADCSAIADLITPLKGQEESGLPFIDSAMTENIDSLQFPSSFNLMNQHSSVIESMKNSGSFTDHMQSEGLTIGSLIVFEINNITQYGVIRWKGKLPDDPKNRSMAGVELDDDSGEGNCDGCINRRRYFVCQKNKGIFIPLSYCKIDSRFQEESATGSMSIGMEQVDSSPVHGVIPPINWRNDLEKMCGKFRGIQGHHNSCYLDATLFSMFTFTSVFDDLLYRPKIKSDIDQYEEVQKVLRDNIVNPLRKNKFVHADKVMILRKLLDDLSSVSGLTSEEKDPEEFLNSLVAQILKAKPFLNLSSGHEAYHYQLFIEKDENLKLPSVQQLFDQSFLASDIKLNMVPPCLIIQMPRFGKSYKMYPRIIPSQLLDITDVIDYSPKQCIICGKLAEVECTECFEVFGTGLESTAFCSKCIQIAHKHENRNSHTPRRLFIPEEFSSSGHIPRIYMELFAVMCIETSHYVTFAKCGTGSDAPWCFFNSMADRKGEQDGFNIPEVVSCKMLPYWLSDEGAKTLLDIDDDRLLPEHAKRLLCDAYMCMYRSPDVQMYR